MAVLLSQANALRLPLADESVQMVVTSPPYWGLRAYQTGDLKAQELGGEKLHDCLGWATGADCGECFVCHVRAWAREVWRVLRKDGTLWLNIGDSYASQGGPIKEGGGINDILGGKSEWQDYNRSRSAPLGLAPKNLVGIPFRVALALQADGWVLRSDIIWSKPNPMPESVTDRPTKAHEYLFLFAKGQSYYYDADAVREAHKYPEDQGRERHERTDKEHINYIASPLRLLNPAGRNRRTVWDIATAPFSGAHFATYPPALVEPCIKAGTSERGCCPKCRTPWQRVVEREFVPQADVANSPALYKDPAGIDPSNGWGNMPRGSTKSTTTGWRPGCECDAGEPVPCVVLDLFAGSGTTLMVARSLGRHGIGFDLSYSYLHEQARSRLELDALDAWQQGKDGKGSLADLPMFAEADFRAEGG